MTTEKRAAAAESLDTNSPFASDRVPDFRRIVEDAPVGVWTLDASGRTTYVNHRMSEILAWTPSEIVGRRFTEFVRPASAAWADAAFEERKAGVVEVDGCCELMTRDGRLVQVRYDASPIRDEAGAVVGALAIVTELPASQQESVAVFTDRRDRELAFLYDFAPIGLCVINRSLQFTRANRRLAALDGIGVHEHIGRTIREVIPAIADQFEHAVRAAIDTGEPARGIEFVVGAEPAARVWKAECSPVVDRAGIVLGITAAIDDVTDQKRVGEQLLHKRRILEMIAAGAPLESTLTAIVTLLETHWPDAIASIMLVDDGGRLHVAAAPGLPPAYTAAIEGMPIGPTAGSCGTAVFRREAVIVSDIEHDPLWIDYRHFALQHNLRACWSVPILTSTGRVVGTIAVYYREPRVPEEAETDLATDSGASLAAIAIERSLTEHELHRKASALAAANQNKDEFLARLAHELRNPLGAIQTALEILRVKMAADSALERPRAVIDRQLRHIVRLIDDLSDLSRIGTGKIELRREYVDVAAIATDALETVRALAASRDQSLHIDLPDLPVFVEGDPARLTQVCVNLLTNAVKYTPPGGRIDLSVSKSADGVAIRVRDNGLGIPARMLPKIFDLYAQVDATTEHSQGGLGIGLHLVQSLVRLHGGSVTAHSRGPGLGSEFEVRLPIVTSEAASSLSRRPA